MGGPGDRSLLTFLVPGLEPAQFDAALVSSDPPQPADALTDQRQGGQSAQAYQVLSVGPSSVDVVAGGPGVVVTRRATGLAGDAGSTGGVPVPGSAWVVIPAVACDPNVPGLALLNAGDAPAEVTLHVLPEAGGTAPPDVSVSVSPARVVAAPDGFLSADPSGAVVVKATTGTVIPSAASSSCGREGISAFAVAAGIPMP